jgi:hypothetical protein
VTDFEPIVPNLLNATRALENKYAPTSPYANPQAQSQLLQSLAQLPGIQRVPTASSVINPLALYDMTRANRGLSPLTPRQSRAALQTLTTQRPATKPRRQGLLQSTISDLRALVGAIPKLPMLAVQEVKQLPQALEQLPTAIAEGGGNPIEALGNVATLPGFRMVPGAFVASQFGDEGQGVQGLAAHPLFTFLDLLPAASGVAKGSRVVKAATAETQAANLARVQQAVDLTGAPGTARLARPPRPLQTLATRRLDDSGAVVPNRFGQVTGDLADAFYSTPTGRAFQATFKERDTSRLSSRYDSILRRFADPSTPRSLLPTTLNGQDILPVVDLWEGRNALLKKMDDAGIDAQRSAELYEIASNPRLPDGTPTRAENVPGLSDTERALLSDIRDWQAERARLTEGELTRVVNIDGTPEVYDLPTAKRLTRAQSTLRLAEEIRDARAMVADPSTVTPERVASLLDDVARRRAEGSITRAMADDLERTYTAALDEAGYVLDEATGNMQQVARPSSDDLLAALRPLARRYPTIPRLIDHIQNGRWASARKDLDAFAQTRAGQTAIDQLPFDIDGLKAELTRLRKRDNTLARTSKYTPERVARLSKRVDTTLSRAVPARFVPAVQEQAANAITARAGEIYATSPDLDNVISMARDRVYDPISQLPEAEVRLLQREARESWRALRDAGFDPIFFSRVSPSQKARLPFTRVADTPVTPAAARARMFDATPYVPDMGAALSRDAMDLLQQRATIAFLDEFETMYGRTRADLAAELYPRAQARAARTPGISVQAHLDRLMRERWSPWDRSKFARGKSNAAFPISGREDLWVPAAMAENIRRLYEPPLPKLTSALQPVMSLFRTSVLPLAPRWHIYNAIGGATLTAIENPSAFRYLPEVISNLWGNRQAFGGTGIGAKRVAHQLQPEGAPPSGFGTMPAEVRAWDAEIKATSPIKDRLAAAHNYTAGRTMAKWFNEARTDRISKIKDTAKRGLEASYNANQLVDDMYRSAIGISARKRALAKGTTPEMAEALAVDSIRRVFQAWDEMTPMERSIMRSVVPFYGWASHILKYAFRYPWDHPLRVSVLGSFARAELADAATGLPDHIRDMVLMGDVRANGVVRALNVGPFNPFRDLPSYFTVAGFLGNLNPILTGVLESVGINVQQGGPSLYPETRYDPETGRLVADPPGNLLSNVIGNISPQANLLTSLIGINESFNETLARDPQAAGRQLLSNLGIPVLYRDINVGEQLIRAELARYEDQENARKEALSTGNLGILDDFPGLAAYGEQVRALEAAGQLDALRPETGAPGAPSGADKAYALQVAALGA